MNLLIFKIETVPDVIAGRRLYGYPADMENLSDEEVVRVMLHNCQKQYHQPITRVSPHLQQIIVISAVLRTGKRLRIDSLGTPESSEAELLQQFFKAIQHYTPTLISWNGAHFEQPVLRYRSLLHSIGAQHYWNNSVENGHTDLVKLLANNQLTAIAPLAELTTLLSFPSQPPMDCEQVWKHHLQGNRQLLRDHCEITVLQTYLIYLRLELIRGNLTLTDYQQEYQQIKTFLEQAETHKTHFKQFLNQWRDEL
jgi:predicted PolB exonuclease-like 3'-5' exonuclease